MGTDTSTPVVPRSSVERIALSAMMSLYMSSRMHCSTHAVRFVPKE
jgi:hypothetical protein